MIWNFIHQYAYFFSLILAILPLTLFLDSRVDFGVLRKILTKRGLGYLFLTVAFWSAYDLIWVRQLGSFPPERILLAIFGVPIEEMLLFAIGFYNVLTVFALAKKKFS
jgi:hypothetical protein